MTVLKTLHTVLTPGAPHWIGEPSGPELPRTARFDGDGGMGAPALPPPRRWNKAPEIPDALSEMPSDVRPLVRNVTALVCSVWKVVQ
jgi:hypothetical protein